MGASVSLIPPSHLSSVVAVHGIHGESRATWFQRPPNWAPSTWLPGAFSDATSKPGRVAFYGYDTSENSGRCYTLSGVYQEAEALLDELLSLRTSDMAVRSTVKPP